MSNRAAPLLTALGLHRSDSNVRRTSCCPGSHWHHGCEPGACSPFQQQEVTWPKILARAVHKHPVRRFPRLIVRLKVRSSADRILPVWAWRRRSRRYFDAGTTKWTDCSPTSDSEDLTSM